MHIFNIYIYIYLFIYFLHRCKQIDTAHKTHEMAAVKPGYKGTRHSHVPGLKYIKMFVLMIDNSNSIYIIYYCARTISYK